MGIEKTVESYIMNEAIYIRSDCSDSYGFKYYFRFHNYTVDEIKEIQNWCKDKLKINEWSNKWSGNGKITIIKEIPKITLITFILKDENDAMEFKLVWG